MRKKKVIKKHRINPDRKFYSIEVSKLINKVMKNGENRKATRIVYEAANLIEKTPNSKFLDILSEAIKNTKPSLETKSRKFGASNRRVPVEVNEKRALTLALRWLVQGAREKKISKPMSEKLAEEIRNAFNKTGAAFKKKVSIHQEATANLMFAR